MKKQKINLFLTEEQHLSDAQMNVLHGGSDELSCEKSCSCGCQGRSTTADNKQANIAKGVKTPGFDACDSILKEFTVTWKAVDLQQGC
ncbi:hypothetical protein JCM15754A_09770 [Prevotella aurantiaca JCM 15754]|uniref:TIGR04149 family rSAM-modified RiPP n=1 Tax=Prevotella aurantiaca TaxID=596085 RepID=UPI000469F4C4|nr:TIGR04149 family rSAM-modified RiPP [Prevotella aurantiaca]